MKKIFSLLGLATALFLLASCDSLSVPSAVKDSFKKEYPNASRVEWDDKEDNGYWKVEFVNGQTKTTVHYDQQGVRVFTEERISLNELPALAQQTLQAQAPGRLPEEVTRKTDGGGAVFYEVEYDNDFVLVLDATGAPLQPDMRCGTLPQPTDSLSVDSIAVAAAADSSLRDSSAHK